MKRAVLREDMIYPDGRIVEKGAILVYKEAKKGMITYVVEQDIPENYVVEEKHITTIEEDISEEYNVLLVE